MNLSGNAGEQPVTLTSHAYALLPATALEGIWMSLPPDHVPSGWVGG
jgi:hypothetical protein